MDFHIDVHTTEDNKYKDISPQLLLIAAIVKQLRVDIKRHVTCETIDEHSASLCAAMYLATILEFTEQKDVDLIDICLEVLRLHTWQE